MPLFQQNPYQQIINSNISPQSMFGQQSPGPLSSVEQNLMQNNQQQQQQNQSLFQQQSSPIMQQQSLPMSQSFMQNQPSSVQIPNITPNSVSQMQQQQPSINSVPSINSDFSSPMPLESNKSGSKPLTTFTPQMEQMQSFKQILGTEEGQRIASGMGLSSLPSFQAITRFGTEDTPFALRQNSVQRIAAASDASARSGGNPYMIAQSFLGMNEKDSNATLAAFFKQSGVYVTDAKGRKYDLNPRDTAWCAAFANSVLKAGGIDGTGSLAARSFLKWGKPTDNPNKGDIVVFSRGKDQSLGHVAFYVGPDTKNPDNILVLGGNQSNAVTIASKPISTVLGYRQPPSPDSLRNVKKKDMTNNKSPFSIESVVKAAQAAYPDNPTMAGIAAAQAIHESNLLNKPSGLALKNNLFGIKGSGTAGSVNMPTYEFIKGKKVKVNAGFAANNTLEDSFIQHKNLMNKGTKSNPGRYLPVLNAQTIEDAANALVKGGYATDPSYAKKLINLYNNTLAPYFKQGHTLDSRDGPLVPINNMKPRKA